MSPSMRDTTAARARDHLLLILSCVLLGVCFVTGGSSQESGAGVMIAQLLAIPVLLHAMRQTGMTGNAATAWPVIAVLLLIVLVPLLQLLPTPEWLWHVPAGRASLGDDLATVGVVGPDYRWSLAPAATERDLLSLLPALALFLSALNLDRKALRKTLSVVIGLALFSLLLGVAQLEAGQDSVLNPYPQWAPAMGGVFANANHQATVFAIALVLSLGLTIDARVRARRGQCTRALVWGYALLASLFAIAIPMTGSRAGPIIAIVPTIALIVISGAFPFDRLRVDRLTQLLFLIATIILGVGVYSAMSWTRGDRVDAIRSALAQQTTMVGLTHAPLGGGIGGFIPLFEQGADVSVLRDEYINNAHNEYAQLWLEGGVLAMAAMLAAFCVLASSVRRLMRLPRESGARAMGLAAMMALLVAILHSWVDYPLRTPALLAIFALLAGVGIRAAEAPDDPLRSPGNTDDARSGHIESTDYERTHALVGAHREISRGPRSDVNRSDGLN